MASWKKFRSRVPGFVKELHQKHLAALGFERVAPRIVARARKGYREHFSFSEDHDTPRPASPDLLPLLVRVGLASPGQPASDRSLVPGCFEDWPLSDLTGEPGHIHFVLGIGIDRAALREAVLRGILTASARLASQDGWSSRPARPPRRR